MRHNNKLAKKKRQQKALDRLHAQLTSRYGWKLADSVAPPTVPPPPVR